MRQQFDLMWDEQMTKSKRLFKSSRVKSTSDKISKTSQTTPSPNLRQYFTTDYTSTTQLGHEGASTRVNV